MEILGICGKVYFTVHPVGLVNGTGELQNFRVLKRFVIDAFVEYAHAKKRLLCVDQSEVQLLVKSLAWYALTRDDKYKKIELF